MQLAQQGRPLTPGTIYRALRRVGLGTRVERLTLLERHSARRAGLTDGTIVYVNPAFEKVSGYSRSEVIGQDPSILKSGKHDPDHYQEMWLTLNQGKVWAGHFINKRKDESLYEEDAIISPMFDDDGRVIHYVAVKRDVTQEVTLEGQLRQAQKMEAVGTLAGGVAHDFNNLLTTIIGFSELALYEDMSDRAKEYISRIPKQGKQAAELISQLLAFSRRAITRRITTGSSCQGDGKAPGTDRSGNHHDPVAPP